MKIMKFGGSSVADKNAIMKSVNIIQDAAEKESVLVVVSALKGVTDIIIDAANVASNKDDNYKKILNDLKLRHLNVIDEIAGDIDLSGECIEFINSECEELFSICDGIYALGELSNKVLDRIMSFGELCSSKIFILAALREGLNARRIDSRDYFVTDDQFGKANVDFNDTEKKLSKLKIEMGEVLVFPGFIARSKSGFGTTLGRDGSDYTAAILGAALKSDVVELWTDVDGVLTANPLMVKDAESILEMTYEEAMELSHFGARVIHPPTMLPVTVNNIPLKVLNTFNPKFIGTVIKKEVKSSTFLITGISTISNVSFIRMEGGGMVGEKGIAGRLFSALAKSGVNLIMISQGSSEHSICFAVTSSHEDKAVNTINDEFAREIERSIVDKPSVEKNQCVLAVVGENMRRRPGIAGKLFTALGDAG
ncbi:MAG: aspartate kinase, partial [Deltaproteobacteria bacterium]|nr:aspartate kinase [Deltaproteobacteria bacterium]